MTKGSDCPLLRAASALANRAKSWWPKSAQELRTAFRTQESPVSSRAIRTSAGRALCPRTSPRLRATWNRTRISGSWARSDTFRNRARDRFKRDSASRTAWTRTPASGSPRPRSRSRSRSEPRPSRDQRACIRARGRELSLRSRRRRGAADRSSRSRISRCAVARHPHEWR